MKLIFLGSGGAFEKTHSALWVEDKTNILIDCGLTVPQSIINFFDRLILPDYIIITHSHADHYFGLPILILKQALFENNKEVKIISNDDVLNKINRLLDLAYGDIFEDFHPNIKLINYKDINQIGDIEISFLECKHGKINSLSLKLEKNKKKIVYMVDKEFDEKQIVFAKDCDILIHEGDIIGIHTTLEELKKLITESNPKLLVITHYPKENINKITETLDKRVPIIFAERELVMEMY